MTPEQSAMNAQIAAITKSGGRNSSTCLNACRKDRRDMGLENDANKELRQKFMDKLTDIVMDDYIKGIPGVRRYPDTYSLAFAPPMQQCRALLRAFGPKGTP